MRDGIATDSLREITREIRARVPMQERAEAACSNLWRRMLPLSAPGEFRLILRLARHGVKLAKLADSQYYAYIFSSLKETMERRLER